MAETLDRDSVVDRLRSVAYPGFSGDIVSHGFVRDVKIADGVVTVRFAPDTQKHDKVEQMIAGIRAELADLQGVRELNVQRVLPYADDSGDVDAGPTAGILPASDDGVPLYHDVAPDAGYGPDGPEMIDGPEAGARAGVHRYEGSVPVLQWEIDPADESLETGEKCFDHDGWEYRVWWQRHPACLVYASIQALRDDDTARAGRKHPVGRNVVVNVVYDEARGAVVAVYGTAIDFRPFVEAFWRGFALAAAEEEE